MKSNLGAIEGVIVRNGNTEHLRTEYPAHITEQEASSAVNGLLRQVKAKPGDCIRITVEKVGASKPQFASDSNLQPAKDAFHRASKVAQGFIKDRCALWPDAQNVAKDVIDVMQATFDEILPLITESGVLRKSRGEEHTP